MAEMVFKVQCTCSSGHTWISEVQYSSDDLKAPDMVISPLCQMPDRTQVSGRCGRRWMELKRK